MNKLINVYDYSVNDINFKILSPNYIKNTSKLPIIFYYHGWSSAVESNIFLGRIFASNEFNVILPEIINHDTRGELDYKNISILKKYFWDTVFQTIKEFTYIYNHLIHLGYNSDKIGVSGSSMGGFISSGIFAENQFVKTMVNINGAVSWKKAQLEFNFDDEEFVLTNIQKEIINNKDPILKMNNLKDRSILILHGDDDETVPIEIQKYSYNELINMNENKENIAIEIFEKINHSKPIDMIKSAYNWFEEKLL